MGKRLVLTLLAAALAATCLLGPPDALAEETPFDEEELYGEDAVVVRTVPDTQGTTVGAEAAIVMEAQTGRVLFSQEMEKQLPIASTTKIMTALIALEQENIDAQFVVDAEAIRVEGSSMGLKEGDKASLRSLAVGMLLASGNDGANAAAVRIAGSIPAFVERMNTRAREIGMENTSFETPSGLDGERHYSTAYDMALLAREALKNESFAAICSQYKMRTAYGDPPYDRWLTNHNKLLNYYEGTVGVKTGFTKKAGRCLVSAVERDGITLIAVTLDCPNDWTVHQDLYDRYFPTLELTDLTAAMPPVEIPVAGGTAPAVRGVVHEAIRVPLPAEGGAVEYDVTAPPFFYAPVRAGQYIGQVEILVDGQSYALLTLSAEADVPLLHPYEEEKSLWERLTGR